MKKIIYFFSAALLCLVACSRENVPVQTIRTTTIAPKEGDLALVTFYVTVPEMPLYATETRSEHAMGDQPNTIENGDLFVAVFGKGENGLGGQLQHFVQATLMKDRTTDETQRIGVDPPITHDLTGDSDEGEGIAGKTFKYAYQVLLPVSEDPLALDFFVGAYDSKGKLYNLDNPLPVEYEKDVMPLLLSINGKAAYWQRVEIPGVFPKTDDEGNYIMVNPLDEEGMPISVEYQEYEARPIEQLKNVRLVRNFAKVTFSVATDEDGNNITDFDLEGFYLVDTPVSGTVAPFSGSAGYNNIYTTSQSAAAIMSAYQGYILSTELSTGIEGKVFKDPGVYEYMYERTVPDLNKPYAESGAILKVKWKDKATVPSDLRNQTRYYKVAFVAQSGAVPILRNIVYDFQLIAIAADTHPSSAEDAYNGHWLGDISANIATSMLDEITNNKSKITVSMMSKTTIGRENEFDIDFWFYPDVSTTAHENDVVVNHNTMYEGQAVTIQIINENVAGHQPAIASFTNITPENADMGTVHVKTNASSEGIVKKSKLKILGQWGTQRALYREVEITVMEKQTFAQGSVVCSVSELAEDEVDQDVTVTVALPDELPRDIFPLRIKIEPQNNGLRSVAKTVDGKQISALPVKHGKSAFDSNKNNYYFVLTVTYDEYAKLVDGAYQYTNTFPCYFKTRLTTGNETAIKINDLNGEYFIESDVNLALPSGD